MVYFSKLLPFNIKSTNPIQKNPHIIKSYSINISHDIFVSSGFLNLDYFQLQNYQSMIHFKHSHAKLSNEFLLIHTDPDFLYMLHPLD